MTITTSRRTDKELDLYFGGRAAYLAGVRASIADHEAVVASIDAGTYELPDDHWAASAGFGVDTDREYHISAIENGRAALIANS